MRCQSTSLYPDFTHEYLLDITFMAVNPDYRRQGIRPMLMRLFLRKVDEHDVDTCYVVPLESGYTPSLVVR